MQGCCERLTSGSVAHDQRPTTPKHHSPRVISLSDHIPDRATVQVDFSRVAWMRATIMAHQLPVDDAIPGEITIPDVSQAAIDQLISIPADAMPLAFHFYVDGSKVHDHQVGAADLLLCEHSDGFAYGGHLCSRVDAAEHSAMIWSLLWAMKCSDWWTTESRDSHPQYHDHRHASSG